MKTHLNVYNGKTKEKKFQTVAVKVESSYAPTNLWMVFASDEIEKHKGNSYKMFSYKKVISIINGSFEYEGYKFDATFATTTTCEHGGIYNRLIDTEGENENYTFTSMEDDGYRNGALTIMVDLDEVKTFRGFENLTAVECFTRLVNRRGIEMDYNLRSQLYIVNGDENNIINCNQYCDIIDPEQGN